VIESIVHCSRGKTECFASLVREEITCFDSAPELLCGRHDLHPEDGKALDLRKVDHQQAAPSYPSVSNSKDSIQDNFPSLVSLT
jgi:hypothetical protein